jgi:hypothetical protein
MMTAKPNGSNTHAARCRLLTRLLAARCDIEGALRDCGELCAAVPHETDLQCRAVDMRLRRMREMAVEVEGILRQGEMENS